MVEVGRSVREFLTHLQVDTGGREYATFKKQMRALSACRMSLGFGRDTVDAKPIERFSAWRDGSGDRDPLAPGVIELTPKFLRLADRVCRAVRCPGAGRSSAQRAGARCLHLASSPAAPRAAVIGERVAWKNLREQFGQEYADPKNFKRKMLSTLMAVRAVYPGARLDQVKGGFVLLPSKPPIPKVIAQVRAIATP